MIRHVTARAPGKVILFGEHAVNRGQSALAASVGLYATCRLETRDVPGYVFRSDAAGHEYDDATREDILRLGKTIDRYRETENYESLRQLAAADFFAPAKYILASALGDDLPSGLETAFASEIPQSCGLGSGGAAYASLASALAGWIGVEGDRERVAGWAHRGDIVSHGGIASRLDSQTSLCGGVIRFVAGGLGEPVTFDPGLCLVIGNTRVIAATSEVNARVRRWLAESPHGRLRYFEAIGLLSRLALEPLESGDWPRLGHLATLNQVLLEKIGVSSAQLERLIDAALGAGAFGAKLAGSGGGGIMFAFVDRADAVSVARAIADAGGDVLMPALAVPGAGTINS
jgi:mevalonate kinase